MNVHTYTENQLVEHPAIGLFTDLGWKTMSALEETFGVNGTLKRDTKGDVDVSEMDITVSEEVEG
jgi:type I restriction enzyme R subunit